MTPDSFLMIYQIKRAAASSSNDLTPTIWVSIVGIAVSGILGPQFTSFATQRANRKQFNRDQNAKRRDDLRAVLDEAAVLLASGVTNLRLIRENTERAEPNSAGLVSWLSQIFPIGQRLRLRLEEDNEVVLTYDRVRDALAKTGEGNAENATSIGEFEELRAKFLDASRIELSQEIPEKQ